MIRLTGQWGVDVAWPLSQDSGVEGLCVERGRGEESGERGRPRRGAREAWHEGLPRPGTSGPLRGTEEVPAQLAGPCVRLCTPCAPSAAGRRLAARGLADRGPDFATESAAEGPAGRAQRRAPGAGAGRGGARASPAGILASAAPSAPGEKIIRRRRRRSEFPGCSHSETQAGKLADAWPVPRETRRAPARLFRKVRAPPAGRAGRVPGPRRRAPPRRSSLSGPCPHRQLPGVRRNPFGQNWLGVPI